MPTRIKRVYGSNAVSSTASSSSSPPSSLASPPSTPTRKRPLTSDSSLHNTPPRKKTCFTFPSKPSTSALPKSRRTVTKKPKTKEKGKEKEKSQKQLTQLHFTLDTTVLRTCSTCDLTYTKGAPDDEILHKTHCNRVQRGLEWGKEEERESAKAGVEELASGVKLSNGTKGRILCFRADVGGKIGAKLSILLDTINLTLSSPPLSHEVLRASKVYLFLLPALTSSSTSHREKIVGCVVAQRISTAMAIALPEDVFATDRRQKPTTLQLSSIKDAENEPPERSESKAEPSISPTLIPVDASSNLYVHPALLPTPMGVPRLFVSSQHRRLGIASQLLDQATKTFILGCPLDPAKGDVAFTQPTGAGKAVLEKWGRGGVRIYEE